MKSENPRITKIRELMQLEERRLLLEAELATASAKMNSLRDKLFEADEPPQRAPSSPVGISGPAQVREARGQRHMRRGQMKEGVLAALTRAGAQGIGISEIAEAVGAPYKNISVWLSTTGRKIPNLMKVAPGRYRLAA